MISDSKCYFYYNNLYLNLEITENQVIQNNYYLLEEAYTKSKRYYHNLNHIEQGLKELELYKENLFYNEIAFAWFYHDFIYDAHQKDNEEKSAEFAYNLCLKIGLKDLTAKNIFDLILSTKYHLTEKMDTEKIICDVDLSILGQDNKIFLEYDTNIRKEYQHVDDILFKNARRKILQGFLDSDSIYKTKILKEKYEKQARNNIKSILNTKYS